MPRTRSCRPTVIGPYVLGECIGAGGMGTVYEAHRVDGDSELAIKILHVQRCCDDFAVRRFRDEADAGVIVTHPHLVSVLDHGDTSEGVPYLVMTRVFGESLAVRIQREGPLPLRRASAILQQLLDGLDALHAAGIVHGDVKTDNLLVERRGDGTDHATLIDLGLAHAHFASWDKPVLAEAGLVSGTPEFMAPEVVRGGCNTPASDIYGAGIVLYETITGTTPFGGGSPEDVMDRQVRDEVVPPSLVDFGRVVPPILERIVMRALAKDPEQRFASAAAFAKALAIAEPCLDEHADSRASRRLTQDTPTLDWNRTDRANRRVARGTPAHRAFSRGPR